MSRPARLAPVTVAAVLLVTLPAAACRMGDEPAAPDPSTGRTVTAPATPEPATTIAPSPITAGTSGPKPTGPAPTTPPTTTTTTAVTDPPGVPEPFDDPQTLAGALEGAELALADTATPEEHRSAWARVHQQAYRDLVTHPSWQPRVRRSLPQDLREVFDLNLRAGSELGALTEPQPSLPGWEIVAPAPVEELRHHYLATETAYGVPWQVLAAIHLVETRFGRIRGDSHAGARGPMQFLPSTWEVYGEGDIMDDGDAVMAAGRYLAAHGAPADLEDALWAYNHSDRYVSAILAHAEAMERHDHYLDVYHRWQVFYRTTDGDVLLEEGYGR